MQYFVCFTLSGFVFSLISPISTGLHLYVFSVYYFLYVSACNCILYAASAHWRSSLITFNHTQAPYLKAKGSTATHPEPLPELSGVECICAPQSHGSTQRNRQEAAKRRGHHFYDSFPISIVHTWAALTLAYTGQTGERHFSVHMIPCRYSKWFIYVMLVCLSVTRFHNANPFGHRPTYQQRSIPFI